MNILHSFRHIFCTIFVYQDNFSKIKSFHCNVNIVRVYTLMNVNDHHLTLT